MLSEVDKLFNLRCSTMCDVERQIKNIYSLIFLSFSFGRIAQLVAHSLHKREVPGSSPVHGTKQSFSSFLVYDDILLASDFYIPYHSLSSFLSY